MKSLPALVLVLVCTLPLAATAQWQWIDKDGRKVFSDQPPPDSIPEKNVLRRGGPPPRTNVAPGAPLAASGEAGGATAAVPATAGNAPAPRPPNGVDKELEEKTRRAEQAEKARRAAEEQKVTQAKAENCQRARQGKATLDSGIRIARMNDKGEREVLDDKARAAEQQRVQSVIDADCR